VSATTPTPRADTLLPDDDTDPAPEVAEEVSLDQQSGRARQIGHPPPPAAAGGLAEALLPPDSPLQKAIDRAIPTVP
jgi:hypothetical protein